MIGRVRQAPAGRNGQTLAGIAAVPQDATSSRPAELQQLLGASIDENRHLTAHVRRLEAELRRSSAQLAKPRGELRGAMQDALTDPLTGLANRRSFDLKLGAVGARAGRSPPAQLMMVDIDHFKRVNDAHGHDTSDEFGLLLRGVTALYVAGIAIRLCEILASRRLVVRGLRGGIEGITLSIGVATGRAAESSAEWYARADAAMYEAKRRGGNQVSIARMLKLKF